MVNPPGYRALTAFCVCFLFLVIFVLPTSAREAADLAFIRKFNPLTTLSSEKIVRFHPQEISVLKLAGTGLIRLYQKFISTQDGPTCNFQPTCSRFGLTCIQEYGIIRGLLLTADRLLRCNGTQVQHYPKDGVTGKYIDPVSDYMQHLNNRESCVSPHPT